MKKALVFFLLLSACVASPEQIEAARQAQQQQDYNTCAGYGFRPNSDGFRNCLLQIDLARQQQRYYNDSYYGYGAGYPYRYSSGIYYLRH